MSLYLLIRDHKAHSGAIEVGWRVELLPGFSRTGDMIFAYHSSVDFMLMWARHPARKWVEKIPLGIIDVRNIIAPEHKLFSSVPVLDRVTYYMMDSTSVGEIGDLMADHANWNSTPPGDPDNGMWIARDSAEKPKPPVSRRQILNAALGAPAGTGSVRDRLQAQIMERMNKLDYWAEHGVWPDEGSNSA